MMQEKLKTQLEKLRLQAAQKEARSLEAAEKLKRMREERRELNSEIAAIERRVRNHRLIETGALVEKILGESVDKGILAGLLDKYKNLFNGSGAAYEIKIAGDTLISRWEEERKAAKTRGRRKAEEADDDGNE